MGMCKKCNGVFGAREMENGVCENCITSISEPMTMINISKSYLTEEERAKIIEEETLRNEIRKSNNNDELDFVDYLSFIFILGIVVYVCTLLYLNVVK